MVALLAGDGKSTVVPAKRAAEWWVEVIDHPSELASRSAMWDDLAWNAIEPNPFYEAALLIPAMERFPDARVSVALVYRSGARVKDSAELCGLFPFVTERRGWLTVRSLWKHIYCFLCTPLIRQGVAIETLRTLWNWLEADSKGPAVWSLPHIAAEGPFQQALVDVMRERQALSFVSHQYNRALLRPGDDAESYCAAHMTCHNRQELRRQRRRLQEQGRIDVRWSDPNDDMTPWIDHFLALESGGWKGREQSALAAAQADAEYFRSIVTNAGLNHQVGFLGLFLDDRPIALKVNFLSGAGSFAFKIAFDESLAKFSPGVQLELENIEWVHQQRGIEWMDSCAKPDHFMISRLWGQQRTIQHLYLSTGRRTGDLAVGLMPALRAVRHVFRRQKPTSKPITPASPAGTPR
ncbi:MAG TPA: GNAT family N-acetyltransferase [Planctomycetaceae bacterium]|nr:GNAT family N-acetyltransferase [Planctomycetaceae bacterium]